MGYHVMAGGIAAGDVHGDGWIDLVTRRPDHAFGFSLYANIGGEFHRQALDLGVVDDLEVFNVALADIDGDSRLDLFVSTIDGGDFLFFNDGLGYDAARMVTLVEPSHAVTASVAFADMDRDGKLDIILGRWAPRGPAEGWRLRPLHIRNLVVWNDGGQRFTSEVMPGVPGQTLTTMIHDFDRNGFLDVFNGDDAGTTDGVVFFDAGRVIRPVDLDSQPFPYHTRTSMSYSAGDWNNDLQTDFYGVQIASSGNGSDSVHSDPDNRVLFEICTQFGVDLGWDEDLVRSCSNDMLSTNSIRGSSSVRGQHSCRQPVTDQHRALCGAASVLVSTENATRNPDGDQARFDRCAALLAHIPSVQRLCDSVLEPTSGEADPEVLRNSYRPSSTSGNILMTANDTAPFDDTADDAGVRWPGWGWNARFTDLDQDGRQDLLVMTGIWLNAAASTTNVLYHNDGSGFVDETAAFGFTDVVPSYSYVAFDFDRDGDVDVIRDNSALRMIVHRNERPAGAALVVSLQDELADSMAVGARVTICVDGETTIRPGPCQVREITASGGFMSSEPIQAHFGLGDSNEVSLIEVRWLDGEVSRIEPADVFSGEIEIHRSANTNG